MFNLLFLSLNCTPEENLRLTKVKKMATVAINSPEFAVWFKSQRFTQTKTQPELSDVLKSVVCYYTVRNRPFYKRFSSVVGYTKGNKIYTYRNKFWAMSDPDLANHLIHESMHLLGFSHSFYENVARPFSIPYAIGDKIQAILET